MGRRRLQSGAGEHPVRAAFGHGLLTNPLNLKAAISLLTAVWFHLVADVVSGFQQLFQRDPPEEDSML